MFISLIVKFFLIGWVSTSSTTDGLLSTGYDFTTTVNVSDETSTTEITSTSAEQQHEPNYEFSPFQVSLHYTYNDNFICGGSIISPKMVLTAAHCMYYRWGGLMPPIIVTISAGRRKLNESSWKTFVVANITLHPLFNETTMEHDLALIEIEGSFEADSLIGQIDVEKYFLELEYSNCIVTGWNQETYEFQVIEVILTSCLDYPGYICTYKKYQDSLCIDNAGNPLVCDGKLVGVLSVEPICEDPSQLAIFENIKHAMSWLNEEAAFSNTSQIKFECTRNVLLLCILFKLFFMQNKECFIPF